MNSTMRQVDSARHPAPNVAVLGMQPPEAVALNLCSVILAVRNHEPVVALLAGPAARVGSLPCGPYLPAEHTSLQNGLRTVVEQQTGLRLSGSQALCTFGEGILQQSSDLSPPPAARPLPVVSLCYLALLPPEQAQERAGLAWQSWYDVFPWEDWRDGKPRCLADTIEPSLAAWARAGGEALRTAPALDRSQRVRIAFGGGGDGSGWDEEKIVERYDLLCEAGLAGEQGGLGVTLWHATLGSHARVLACAIAELRRTIKSRPAIFELMPELFTLFELQKAVEGILGPHLHKQNFRRLVEGEGLVEPTEDFRQRTGGRPARLYRFRRTVLLERPAPGVRVKPGRV